MITVVVAVLLSTIVKKPLTVWRDFMASARKFMGTEKETLSMIQKLDTNNRVLLKLLTDKVLENKDNNQESLLEILNIYTRIYSNLVELYEANNDSNESE